MFGSRSENMIFFGKNFFIVQVTPPDGRDSGAETLGRCRAHHDRERDLVRLGWLINFSVAAVFARAMVLSCGERVGVCALKLPFCGP